MEHEKRLRAYRKMHISMITNASGFARSMQTIVSDKRAPTHFMIPESVQQNIIFNQAKLV